MRSTCQFEVLFETGVKADKQMTILTVRSYCVDLG